MGLTTHRSRLTFYGSPLTILSIFNQGFSFQMVKFRNAAKLTHIRYGTSR